MLIYRINVLRMLQYSIYTLTRPKPRLTRGVRRLVARLDALVPGPSNKWGSSRQQIALDACYDRGITFGLKRFLNDWVLNSNPAVVRLRVAILFIVKLVRIVRMWDCASGGAFIFLYCNNKSVFRLLQV